MSEREYKTKSKLTEKERKILEFWKELGATEIWVDRRSIEFSKPIDNDTDTVITMGHFMFEPNTLFTSLVKKQGFCYEYLIDDLLKGEK